MMYLLACLIACTGEEDPQVPAPIDEVISGGGGTCVRRGMVYDCRLMDWGHADFSQLSVKNYRYKKIYMDAYTTCGILSNNIGECWGLNHEHQAEIPTDTWKMIIPYYTHACAINFQDQLICWGFNNNGSGLPFEGTYIDAALYSTNTCGVKTDGTVICKGDSRFGMDQPPEGTFVEVDGASGHACGLSAEGRITCWGAAQSPLLNPPAGEGYSQIQVSSLYACALNSERKVVCWGDNSYGGLLEDDGTWFQISSDYYHTCGVREDRRTVKCWGCREVEPGSWCDWENPGQFLANAG